MKTQKKHCKKIIALALALIVGVNTAISEASVQEKKTASVRTIHLSEKYMTDLSEFDTYSILEDEENPTFTGMVKCSDEASVFFDNVSLDEDTEDYNIQYDCTFDMDTLQYTLTATLLDEEENMVESDTLITDAFVTENGGLDAYIELENEKYLLSDFCTENGIAPCGLFSSIKKTIVRIAVVYVVVAETAEQIKARSNYKYNKKLEADGKGVTKGNYITKQNETDRKGYNCGNYKFGFTTFSGVGCEVASAYNAMIKLGKAEKLSETIYCFEKWAIELSIGWGNLGSNPLELGRYLEKKGIEYDKYTSLSKFKSAVAGKKKCYIIMSRWNNPVTTGLHTFFIEKKGAGKYESYNWDYEDMAISMSSINDFNNGKGFIVGYIVWVD